MATDTESKFRGELLEWADRELRDFPWRDESRSLYEVFVAEFFLTQTPAENVDVVYPEFLALFSSLEQIAATSVDEIETAIEPLGFQRMRAEALAEIASDREQLPTTPEELLELPRVGPYVANASICFAFGRPLPIVDRNVVRVYKRVFGPDFPDDDRSRREFARAMLPADGEAARTYNFALVDFGALVCTKRDPRCSSCFASEYCSYYESSVAADVD